MGINKIVCPPLTQLSDCDISYCLSVSYYLSSMVLFGVLYISRVLILPRWSHIFPPVLHFSWRDRRLYKPRLPPSPFNLLLFIILFFYKYKNSKTKFVKGLKFVTFIKFIQLIVSNWIISCYTLIIDITAAGETEKCRSADIP
jgi:hypothetical protein